MLTEEEIAGYMNWRGPGAYTAAAMRNVQAAISEAVRREREACAMICDDDANNMERAAQHAMADGEHDEVSSIRSTAWKLSVAAARIRARSNAEVSGDER